MYSLVQCVIVNFRNKRFGRGTEEDSHEALRCILSALRQEEIKVCYRCQYIYVTGFGKWFQIMYACN